MTLAVLPLYFEDEDADLWEHLAAVAPDARLGLVKEALREFLGKELQGREQLNYQASGGLEAEFGLESLFVRLDNPEVTPVKDSRPWEHLLKEVIGIEEDESVITAIQALAGEALGSTHEAQLSEPVVRPESSEVEDVRPLMDQGSEASGRLLLPASQGMAHLLQVIGEEEDEAIIAFFKSSG